MIYSEYYSGWYLSKCNFCQSVPLAFFVIASKEEFIRPNTTKMPPTMAQIEIIKRDRRALDFVIDIETGENSKIIITMLS